MSVEASAYGCAAAPADSEAVIQRATALIMSVGQRGIRLPTAENSLRLIGGLAPALLPTVLDQSAASTVLRRKWIQLIRAVISGTDEHELPTRLSEKVRDWLRHACAFPAALELAEAIGFPRRDIAVLNVAVWISRVARESGEEPTAREVRALVALAVIGGQHEDPDGGNSVYLISRGRQSSLTAMIRARALAPRADAMLRVVPELVRRGASFDEDLIESLLDTAESGQALLDGQL